MDSFQLLCVSVGLPVPVCEYRFCSRRWRWDYAWPDAAPPLAVEIDGGAFVGGRHVRGQGVENDCAKLSTGVSLGWRVLRVTPRMVRDGRLLTWCEMLLRGPNDATDTVG